MNDDRAFERATRDWLEAGSDRTPPATVDAVLLAVRTTPQERDLRIPWRLPPMNVRVFGAASATVVLVALIAIGLPRLRGAGASPTPSPSSAVTASQTPTALPTPVPTASAVPTPFPSFAVRPGSPDLSQVSISQVYGYGMRYPSNWTLTAGLQANRPDYLPAIGTGRADYYGDGIASGVYVTAGPLSATRVDLATFSAFVATHVTVDYPMYHGPGCTESTRSLVLDGEPANEYDFYCPAHTALWVAAVHRGLAYQVAWLDDGPFTESQLRPKFDKILQTFTFAP